MYPEYYFYALMWALFMVITYRITERLCGLLARALTR